MSTERLAEIHLVLREKEEMIKAAKELLELSEPKTVDELAFRQKALEFLGHLSTFGSFFDHQTQYKIQLVVRYMTATIIHPTGLFAKTQLNVILPLAIGLQVNFKKRPFKTIGFDVKALNTQISAHAER